MICCLLWSSNQSNRMHFVICAILQKMLARSLRNMLLFQSSQVQPVFWTGSHGAGLDYSAFWHVAVLRAAVFRTAVPAKGNRLRSPPTVCGSAQSENLWVINHQIYYRQKHHYVLCCVKLPLNRLSYEAAQLLEWSILIPNVITLKLGKTWSSKNMLHEEGV